MEIQKEDNLFYLGDSYDPYAKIEFVIIKNILTINHTEVDSRYSGMGIGRKLVKEVVDYARANKLYVKPICSFAVAEFNKHPEYQDLLSK